MRYDKSMIQFKIIDSNDKDDSKKNLTYEEEIMAKNSQVNDFKLFDFKDWTSLIPLQ